MHEFNEDSLGEVCLIKDLMISEDLTISNITTNDVTSTGECKICCSYFKD